MKISTVGANVKFEFPSCGWSLVVEPTCGSMTCHGCAHLMAVLKYLNRLEVESRYNESFAPVDLVRDNVHNAMQS
jgi:hypothetical protein